MSDKKREHLRFFKKLFSRALPSITAVFLCSILYYWFLPQQPAHEWLLLLLMGIALFKIAIIVHFVYNRLGDVLGESHYMLHILGLFGLVIALNVFTFTADYFGLYLLDPAHFDIKNFEPNSRFHIYFQSFYFSLISYSTVGLGDMTPATFYGKILVMLEIGLYFFVILFGTAHINKINIKD
ncbi:potassium channel family protein [Zeaxanthinibacter enoshimensis]|uniref:Ion channel n=1 Tax=Zeaxanthinibacter enoshimensis TaxID=392009 RepID=A0A4R6TM63_9FLAO|nr:potassium channel family protein [Zeaxanthinibacter enoshimensis]TDQ30918.1 ion channel [Zeaxanthinibacter enoshimensis]